MNFILVDKYSMKYLANVFSLISKYLQNFNELNAEGIDRHTLRLLELLLEPKTLTLHILKSDCCSFLDAILFCISLACNITSE